MVADRPAHSAFGGCEEPGDPCRACVSQGRRRNSGRRLATCGTASPAPSPASRWSISRPAPAARRLALAAAMDNHGQIYATDIDKRQLAPIHERIARAGARNIQVRTPRGEADMLADLAGRIDLALIDAPCTGTGAWRRNPDAKWRVRPGALARAPQAAGSLARSRRRAGEARRPHRLYHLLGPWRKRTATRCSAFVGGTRIFPWKSPRKWRRRWASAPIFLAARRLSRMQDC